MSEAETNYQEKLLDLRRVARVVAGGKRLSFRATVVVGDRNGHVGLGIAKGKDVAQALEKARQSALKNLVEVPIVEGTIPHEVKAKFCAAEVILKPAKAGHGLVAGGPVRIIAQLAGIKNLSAKILSRTPNKLSNAQATLKALKKLRLTTPFKEKLSARKQNHATS